MKRISFLLVTLALCAPPALRAQDAATEERLNKLSGRIEDLTAAQEALKKQVNELTKELQNVREQSAKPNTSYAPREDLNHLAEAIKEVDRKRMDDAEKVHTELLKLRDVLKAPPTSSRKAPVAAPKDNPVSAKPGTPENGYEYVVKSGDTLGGIVQACKDQKVKVTMTQILKANPGLKPDLLIPGKKIFIPAPQP
jgi:LysM repeat protein